MDERIDHDAPGPADAYVLRIEDSAGYRLKVRVSATELENAETLPCLAAKADMLLTQFLLKTGKLTEAEAEADGWKVIDRDGLTLLTKVIKGGDEHGDGPGPTD